MQEPGSDLPLEVTVLVPVLNEEKNVGPLVEKTAAALDKAGFRYELLFVDDGSTDGTFDALTLLAKQCPWLRVISFTRNFGKAAAYSAGFTQARGDIIVTMDGDLQDDPEEISEFVARIREGNDLVTGWKYEGKGTASRAVPSRIFNLVTARMTGLDLHDFNCPFKAYRRSILPDLMIYGELHRFIPVLAHARGYRVAEIKSKLFPRIHGHSKYGVERFLRGFLDLLTVLMITKFRFRPLHLFGGTGFIAMFSGTVVTGFLVFMHIMYRLSERGWIDLVIKDSWNMHVRAMLIVGLLLFVVGFQFVSLGLLAELINFREDRQDTPYRVRASIG